MINLSQNQMNILEHTMYRAANGNYCGNSVGMQVLVNKGLMTSAGFNGFTPDEYFRLTVLGHKVLNER